MTQNTQKARSHHNSLMKWSHSDPDRSLVQNADYVIIPIGMESSTDWNSNP